MKKLLFLSYFLIPLLIISQDLDEAYLESLPEDVRNDVLEEMKNREKEESPVYRRPSTMIEKQQALAERLAIARALLDELSEDIDEMVNNLHVFRKKIKGSFNEKVTILNKLTRELIKND